MDKQFNGFDAFKADEELKEKTRDRIAAADQKVVPMKRRHYRRSLGLLAACAAMVLLLSPLRLIPAITPTCTTDTGGGRYTGTDGGPASAPGGSGPDCEEYSSSDPAENGDEMDTYLFSSFDTAAVVVGDTGVEKKAADGGKVDFGSGEAPGDAGESPDISPKEPPPATKPLATAGTLTAKFFCDNEDFAYWTGLVGMDGVFRSFAENWRMNTLNRVVVNIKNGQSVVCGAKAELLDGEGNKLWSAVTDNRGRAYLFYNFSKTGEVPAKVVVSKDGKTAEKALDSQSGAASQEVAVELSGTNNPARALDLMFVVDTTGSMRDELEFLQEELADIIARVKAEDKYPMRLSVNFYRDEGDEYVVRPFPFTTDTDKAVSDLRKQHADGGGDFEEAVEQALQDAIHGHDWNGDAYAKLLFLILDAPPHDFAAEDMRRLVRDAAEQGIRIIPIAGSDTDQNTEFLMRAIDIATGGAYLPLTDDSGVGDAHMAPTGESSVYKLNDLLVKIIGDYMK
ncbi:MAG: VWA domain-containing protein [Oscillospiraceae bacterium]|nr:VWA domain-containing protein [Oscillospiraceae bacterium]